MNKQSASYIELAMKLTNEFRNRENVKAIIVTGSAGIGEADEYSDLDMVIYYSANPAKDEYIKEKKEALNSGGNVLEPYSDDGFAVYKIIDGCKCDFAHIPVRSAERIFKKVREEFSTEETEHRVVSGFINSVSIYGDEWVNSTKEKIKEFPQGLSEKVVRNNMGTFHNIWEVEHHALGRNDDFVFYERMNHSLKRVINILCGLNGIYLPGKMKGIMRTVNQMKLKPAKLENCIRTFYSADKRVLLKEFTALIEETLSLTEKYMPAIDTTRSRNIMYMQFNRPAIK